MFCIRGALAVGLALILAGCTDAPEPVPDPMDDGGFDSGPLDADSPEAEPDVMPIADIRFEDLASDPMPEPGLDAEPDARDAEGDAAPDVARDVPDAEPDVDPPDPDEVLRADGLFLEVVGEGEDPEWREPFGEMGTRYGRIEIEFDVFMAGWREALFDRDILSHNMFGLSRIAPRSYQRYLLGLGAQIKASQMPGMRRRALFYARVDLEERPQGQGYMGYTSFRRDFGWTPGTTYQIHAVLDVVGARQTLTIAEDGAVVARIEGEIGYMTPALTTGGFFVDFGGEETTHRDVKTVGWRYSNLVVRASRLP